EPSPIHLSFVHRGILMSRSFLPCLALLLLAISLTSAQAARPASSSLQVVYLQDGTTLTTYNVDPQTLIATQVGQPFQLPMATFTLLIPSLNGEFLYILGADSSQNQSLWVFATD